MDLNHMVDGGEWMLFNKVWDSCRNRKAECKGCKARVAPCTAAMLKHATTCHPLVLKGLLLEPTDIALPPAKQRRLQVFATPSDLQRKIDRQIVRMVVCCNTPFALVEHPEFKKLMELLRPGVRTPRRRRLAGRLLEEVYLEEVSNVKDYFRGKRGALSVDGWSTLSRDPVIGIAITVAGLTVLFATVDTTGEPHTASHLMDLVDHYIDEAENTFQCKIVSVGTDNASNVRLMRDLLHEKRPDLLYVGCQAHWLNLLLKDLANDVTILEKILEILKWVSNNCVAELRLSQPPIPLPPVPNETRWNSKFDALVYFNKFWGQLVAIVARKLLPRDPIRQSIETVMVRRSGEELEMMYRPVAQCLDRLQRDNCTLALCVQAWMTLLGTFPNQVCVLFFVPPTMSSLFILVQEGLRISEIPVGDGDDKPRVPGRIHYGPSFPWGRPFCGATWCRS